MTKIAAGANSSGARVVMWLRCKIEEGGFGSATSGSSERERESMVLGRRERRSDFEGIGACKIIFYFLFV